MRRICLDVAYDGTRFHGWQLQSDLRTVQGVLTRALREALGETSEVEGASRTDTGVHAYGQAAAFSTSTPIPDERLPTVINQFLPSDLRVREAREVGADFQPRFASVGKLYRYTFRVGDDDDPFIGPYTTRMRRLPDVESMQRGARALVGEHDFSSFQNRNEPAPATTVRRLFRVDVRRDDALVHVEVVGSAFLYKMVRNIAGTLLDVGQGKTAAEDVAEILAARDRAKAGNTAPPQGLTLVRVLFEDAEVEEAARDPRRLGGFLQLRRRS